MHLANSVLFSVAIISAVIPISTIADVTQSGVEGRWQTLNEATVETPCTYALQLNSDYSWEDVSNMKYRSGIYMLFDDVNGASSENKTIVLSTTTDNFMPDCGNQPYSSIGTSQVLDLSLTKNEIRLSNLYNLLSPQKNHPIPASITLSALDSSSQRLPLRPDTAFSENSPIEQVETVDTDLIEPTPVPTSPGSRTPQLSSSIESEITGSSSSPSGSDALLLPEIQREVEPETPLPPVDTPEAAPFLGTLIEKEDWVITKAENVSIGDHSEDYGFVNSQPDDKESIKVTIRSDSNWGTGTLFILPPGVKEAWVGFCIRFPQTWNSSIGGKLPGFSGNTSIQNGGQGGKPSYGDNAWSARMLFGAYDSSIDSVPLGQYIYHTDQSSINNYGDPDWWAPGPKRLFSKAARISRSQWHSIKQRIRINSTFKHDGIIEAWVDGSKVYSRTNLNFTNNENFREIYRFWLDTYHGGAKNTSHEQHVYYDQINYSIGSDHTKTNCVS